MTIKTIDAWSISGLLEFEQCPHRAYLRRIKRSPQPELEENHPLERGRRVHKEVEDYISGKTDDFPSTGKKLRELIEFCREQYQDGKAIVEDPWGFDEWWHPTEGWFVDGVWCRMATDCTVFFDETTAAVYDWKTGKSFGNEVRYMQQMQVYAIGAFAKYPDLTDVEVSMGFLDDGKVRSKHFERGPKLNKIIARFTERGNKMTNCVDFRPKPNAQNCKFCPYGPGGTDVCVHGVSPL